MRLALFWLAVSSRARYDPGVPTEPDGRVPSRRPSDREVADSGVRREEAERMPWFPSHSTVCDGRPCAPGEGNLQHVREDTPRGWRYKQWTQPYVHREAWVQARSRDVPHSPDDVAVYGDAVALAKRTALDGRVVVTSGDWDYRELVLNFVLHAHKLAYHNTLVLSMEAELHSDLTARAIPSADLSHSLAAWNETCLQRHIQVARTERHVAVAAMLVAGIDVLLCDATVVLLRPVVAELAAIPADLLVQRDAWPEDPVRKVGVAANAGFYYAHGTAAVSEFVLSAVRRGLIEFYLRWNNIGDQYGLSFVMADAKMDAKADGGAGNGRRGGRGRSSPTANETTLATFHPSGSHCKQRGNCLRLGWLPYDRFPRTGSWDGLQPSAAIYHLTHGCMQEAAPCSVPGSRPFRGHRQRQDRYEKVDFDDMRTTLRALGMWLVDATPSYRYRRPPLPLRPEL